MNIENYDSILEEVTLEAYEHKHQYVDSLHVLKAILTTCDTTSGPLFW
jgi:transcriptional regulatory protein LevR